jgi:hypothetical protein
MTSVGSGAVVAVTAGIPVVVDDDDEFEEQAAASRARAPRATPAPIFEPLR